MENLCSKDTIVLEKTRKYCPQIIKNFKLPLKIDTLNKNKIQKRNTNKYLAIKSNFGFQSVRSLASKRNTMEIPDNVKSPLINIKALNSRTVNSKFKEINPQNMLSVEKYFTTVQPLNVNIIQGNLLQIAGNERNKNNFFQSNKYLKVSNNNFYTENYPTMRIKSQNRFISKKDAIIKSNKVRHPSEIHNFQEFNNELFDRKFSLNIGFSNRNFLSNINNNNEMKNRSNKKNFMIPRNDNKNQKMNLKRLSVPLEIDIVNFQRDIRNALQIGIKKIEKTNIKPIKKKQIKEILKPLKRFRSISVPFS